MNKPPAINLSFYSSPEYVKELLKQINHTPTNGRILLVSMGFRPDEPPVDEIMSALIQAARRGVKTSLLVDAHTFLINSRPLETKPGPLWLSKELPNRLSQPYEYRLKTLRQLSQEPAGEYAIINPPNRRFRLPIAGRSHIKLAVIGNNIFIGGYNLQSTALIDMMVELNSSDLSNWIYELFQKVQTDKQVWRVLHGQDVVQPVDNNTTLLIDAGLKNQSVILDTAVKLIDEAKTWILLTSQFFPNNVTAEALIRAHKRGVKVEIIFSHPSMHGRIGSVAHRANMLRESMRVPSHFFDGMLAKTGKMLHAKLLATDSGTMIGSHNYVKAGVQLGTAEIAIFSRSASFTSQALAALERAQAL